MTNGPEEQQGPVVRDKRRIDPETGELRVPADQPTDESEGQPVGQATGQATGQPAEQPAPGASAEAGGKEDNGVAKIKAKLDERTNDLQRVQAEYANYRKRVERDRVAVREQALANVLIELLPVLDDIGRARDHDEFTGGFKSVGEALEAKVAKLGLERYGEKGEPFDPTVHEALTHSFSTEVTEPTCVEILQPGYRVGGRILRPARVAVAEPEEAPAASIQDQAIEELTEPESPAEAEEGSGGVIGTGDKSDEN